MGGATYYLLRNPTALKTLQEEIRGAFKVEDDITIANTGELKYLIAVLNEALRVYPPVPIGLPRIVPEGGAVINGTWVPAGVSKLSALLSLLPHSRVENSLYTSAYG